MPGRHSQQAKVIDFLCEACREYECDKCIDVLRGKVFEDPPRLCKCQHAEFQVLAGTSG